MCLCCRTLISPVTSLWQLSETLVCRGCVINVVQLVVISVPLDLLEGKIFA